MSVEPDEVTKFEHLYGTWTAPEYVRCWPADECKAFRERYRKWLAENHPEFLQLAKGPNIPIPRDGKPEKAQFENLSSTSTSPEDFRIVDDEDRAFQERYGAWLAANPPEMTEQEMNRGDFADLPDIDVDRARYKRFEEWLEKNSPTWRERRSAR